jgi:hypothetical protein
MTCIAVYAMVRATITNSVLRTAFIVIGCFAPLFAIYVLFAAIFSKEKTTEEEIEQISQTADLIEKGRQKKFGNVVLPSHRRLKIEYVRALNRTAETIGRVIEQTA